MKHFLVIVDIQKDFVDGALGTKEAQALVPLAAETIEKFQGDIFVTYDTHFENYLSTAEGKKLQVAHCIKGKPGWELDAAIAKALEGKAYTPVEKLTFGSVVLPRLILQAAGGEDFDITLLGLCTDICVVSNALILKANFPEKEIAVESACCAGVTPESHAAALQTMAMCQITVK